MINLNSKWDLNKRRNQTEILDQLIATAALDTEERQSIVHAAVVLVEKIRSDSKPSLMDVFWRSMACLLTRALHLCALRKHC